MIRIRLTDLFRLAFVGPCFWAVPALAMDDGQELPDGLDVSDWQQIRAQVVEQQQAPRYRAASEGDDFVAGNPAHGFEVRYRADGRTDLSVSAPEGERRHHISLRPQHVGYAGSPVQMLDSPLARSAEEAQVTTRWNDSLHEWWVNSSSGLEQWFELAAPPAGRKDESAPLVLGLVLESSLAASLQGSGAHQHLRLQGPDTTVRFEKLEVFDADGRRLPATLQLDGRELAYVIDDREARYPLTIDPTFAQQAYLKASNTDAFDRFGSSVAVSGDTVVVGADGEDSATTGVDGDEADNSAGSSGAVYVFVRESNGWSQQAYLKASNTEELDEFGQSVAVSGDTVVVGAPHEQSAATGVDEDDTDNSASNAGAAYVFVRDGNGDWSQQAYLKASNTDADDRFGRSVAVSGDTVVVGAYLEESATNGVDGDETDNSASNAGAAYVFVRDGNGDWSQQAYLKASNTGADDWFGRSVAVSGDTVVVGAPLEDSDATGVDGNETDNSATLAGAAYVFVRDGNGDWSQQAYLKASNTDADDWFGRSVAVSGDTVVVGAPLEDSVATGVNGDETDDLDFFNAGAAYVFVRESNSWSQQAYLKASNTGAEDQFGFSVAVSGDTVVIAALDEESAATGVDGDEMDNSATGAGAAYVFVRESNGWSQQAYLKASNTEEFDGFGWSVTVSGDTVVVGAPLEDSGATGVDGNETDNSASTAGAAHVFDLATFTVGGMVSGLEGDQVVLQNNGGDDQVVTADGGFTFTAQDDGSDYNVTVATQPSDPSQTCTVANGGGTLAGADVSNVEVACTTDQFTVGGMVSGLEGDQIVLQNNGGDDQVVTADGGFTFTAQDDGSDYNVTVASQPNNPSQTCTVANGSGTLAGADVSNVEVACTTDQFTVGGMVSGLEGDQIVLQNNGGDDQVITTDGGFTFTAQDDGAAYAVTVLTQPVEPIQTCAVSNGSGNLAGSDVTDVQVQCSTEPSGVTLSADSLDFGIVLTGEQTSQLVTLTNSGTGELEIDQISDPALPFALSGGSCLDLPLTLDPSESCELEITFTSDANSTGENASSIDIVSNADSSPDTITLRGTSVLPTPVPVLGPLGLIMLALLLAGLGRCRLRAPV